MLKNKRLIIFIGALFALLLVLLSYYYMTKKNHYYAIFRNVQFLEIDADVLIDRVKVGRVNNIDFREDSNGELIVSMRINRDINLPDNSVAQLSEKDINNKRSVLISLKTSDSYYQHRDTIKSYDFNFTLDSLIDLSMDVKAMIDNNAFHSSQDLKTVFAVQLFSCKKAIPLEPENFNGLKEVYKYSEMGSFKYVFGKKDNLKDAQELKLQLQNMGYQDAFIVVFRNGKRISISEI